MKRGNIKLVSGGPIWPCNGKWFGFHLVDQELEPDLVAARQSSAKWIVFQTALVTLILLFKSGPTSFAELLFTAYLLVFFCVHVVLAVVMGMVCDQNRSRLAAYAVCINFMNLIIPLLCSSLYMPRESAILMFIQDFFITVGSVGAMISFYNQISSTVLVVQTSLFILGHTLRVFLPQGAFSLEAALPKLASYNIANTCFALVFATIWFSITLSYRFKTWQGNLPMASTKEEEERNSFKRVVGWDNSAVNIIPGASSETKASNSSSHMGANLVEPDSVGLALQAHSTSSEFASGCVTFSQAPSNTRQDQKTDLHEGRQTPSLIMDVRADDCTDPRDRPMDSGECVSDSDCVEMTLCDTQGDKAYAGAIASRTISFHSDSSDCTILAHDLVADQNILTDALQSSVSMGTCALPSLIGSNMEEYEVSTGITAMLRAKILRAPLLRNIHEFVTRSSSVVASCPCDETPDSDVHVLARRIDVVPSGSRHKFVERSPSLSRLSTPRETPSPLDIVSGSPTPFVGRLDNDDFMLAEL